ncbi:Maternal DNA replication licensing factor mcm3 [Trichinella zimbabwensis]|uniref:DNA replication licensing factor MCM3 n=1 Tax=Trichinella zimbabwensis TaxID=268475 RepID=A0A0V1HLQ3_9BILA|nr:Maternal DNA replication licensing factor mcm3 [Trichinella zimbabwensis]
MNTVGGGKIVHELIVTGEVNFCSKMAQVYDADREQELANAERDYLVFLDDASDSNIYTSRIQDMIQDAGCRLVVNINDLRRKFPERAKNLLSKAAEEIPCFERALRNMVYSLNPEFGKKYENFYVGFEGSFGIGHVNPRTLKSHFLGNLVCCEGIVTKCSLIYPKIVRSVHYCPATSKTVEKRYADLTSFETIPSNFVYPTEDENKNPYETEYGLSTYRDHQTFSVQELPESAPIGQLPRSVDIIADGDLTDRCSPGDRVRIVGVYRCLPNKQGGFTSGLFRTVLIANNIQLMSKEAEMTITPRDMADIRNFIRMKDKALDILVRSVAPSIHGHDEVKKAILCLLMGGTEKNLSNGTRLRGDINVLLIGDPSVAKSQILRYVLNIAPRAVTTTGRGSSGVGLTAAVVSDAESGEKRLEAGAMVLADRGVVCIDEFDKMSDIDRTAIHEVMEQGKVTIAKAGIQAKLNARCSVLAAANPVFGKYDDSKTPMENISMQDSILSRFDLLFVLLDEHNAERDTMIASHVVNLHCYRAPGEDPGAVFDDTALLQGFTTEDISKEHEEDDEMVDNTDTDGHDIFEKNTTWLTRGENEHILTLDFLRKYIQYAKKINPVFTENACQYISEKYADLRAFDEKHSDKEKTMPVTARMLETMIRLSTAFAKMRFGKKITTADAEKAYSLLSYAKPQERLDSKESKKKKSRLNIDEDDEDESTPKRKFTSKRKTKKGDETTAEDVYEFGSESSDADEISFQQSKQRLRQSTEQPSQEEEEEAEEDTTQTPAISVDRFTAFRRHLRQAFDNRRAELMSKEEAIACIQEEAGNNRYSNGEIVAALERLSDENAIMIADGNIFLI